MIGLGLMLFMGWLTTECYVMHIKDTVADFKREPSRFTTASRKCAYPSLP